MSEYSKGYAQGAKDATDDGIKAKREIAAICRAEQIATGGAFGYCTGQQGWWGFLLLGVVISIAMAGVLIGWRNPL